MRRPGDRQHGREDEANGEPQNRLQVSAKIAPRSEETCRIEKRRKKENKDDVRTKSYLREAGDETQCETGENEQNGIRQRQFLREHDKYRQHNQKRDDDLERLH